MVLPQIEEPTCHTEGDETEARHDCGSPCEVGAPLMLVEVIGDETVPSRHGELTTSEVECGAGNDQPRTKLRIYKREKHNWNPSQALADGADADQRLPVGKPSEQLY